MELVAIQFRMCCVKRVVIYRRCKPNDRRGISGNTVERLRLSYLNIARIFIGVEDILNGITSSLSFLAINKRNFIARFIQGNVLTTFSRTISSNGNRILRDILTYNVIRVSHNLVISKRITLFVDIVNRIAQRMFRPMCVNGSIRLNRSVPVKQRIAVNRGEPSIETITGFDGRIGRRRSSLLFLERLIIRQFRGWIVAVNKTHGVSGGNPLGIENKIIAWHGGALKTEAVSQLRVRIPPAPSVIRINTTSRFVWLEIPTTDVRFEEDILNLFELGSFVLENQVILRTIVIEVVSVFESQIIPLTRTNPIPTCVVMALKFIVGCIVFILSTVISPVITVIIGGNRRNCIAVTVISARSPAVSTMLYIAVYLLGAQIVGVQANLRICIFDHPGSVWLLQPIFGISIVRRVSPAGCIRHDVIVSSISYMVPNQLVLLRDVG